VTPPQPESFVWDGTSPQDLHEWCTKTIGPGTCNYVWGGVNGYHVTIRTASGHELLRYGDAILRVGPDQLTIVRADDPMHPRNAS